MVNVSCAICHENFANSEVVNATKCGHMFHQKCLRSWLDDSETCPECDEDVTHADIHKMYFGLPNGRRSRRSNTEEKIEELQRTQSELVEALSDLRLEINEKEKKNRRMERELEELKNDRERRSTIINENGTVVVCERYEPTTVNVGISLLGPLFPLMLAGSTTTVPMLKW